VTLQDLGNLGEFLGSIGVIASLVYLAIQIRQNTRSVRSAAYQAAVASSVEAASLFASSETLSEAFSKGFRDFESLKGPERYRFGAYAYGLFRSYENLFYQHAQGAIEEQLWLGFRNMLQRDINVTGMTAWWDRERDIFSSEFLRYVDGLRK
jgi:hypothetical protein